MNKVRVDEVLGVDGLFYSKRKEAKGPQFYLQRRRQLLLAKFSAVDPTVSESSPQLSAQYLSARKNLLEQKFGRPQLSRSSSRQSSNFSTGDFEVNIPPIPARRASIKKPTTEIVPSKIASASAAITGSHSLGENYAFVGMHHIFEYNQPVPCVRFANNDKRFLASCCMDGSISICQIIPDGSKLCSLLGHRKAVTDIQWSAANEFILSTSLDRTIRLWDVTSGTCLRTVTDNSEVLCCLFHPENNNLFVVGNRSNEVKSFNLSTGKLAPNGIVIVGAPVTALAFNSNGQLLYAGTARGEIQTLSFSSATGAIQRLRKTIISKSVISSLSFSSWYTREKCDPSLLVSCKENLVKLFGIDDQGKFILKNTFMVQNRFSDAKSIFCPLMSFLQGACIVSGSEDTSVLIFNVMNKRKPLVNKLQGHVAPVLGVCWAYDESFLASSAADGTVIVWKRAPVAPESANKS